MPWVPPNPHLRFGFGNARSWRDGTREIERRSPTGSQPRRNSLAGIQQNPDDEGEDSRCRGAKISLENRSSCNMLTPLSGLLIIDDLIVTSSPADVVRMKNQCATLASLFLTFIFRGLVALLVVCLFLVADAMADASGTLQFLLPGNSDTRVSLPCLRPATASAVVLSASGNLVAAQGSPGWGANDFVYALGTQSNSYFLLVRSGAREGSMFDIAANVATSLTLNLNGDSLNGIGSGDAFEIIPHWTLGTVFPAGQGINASPSPGNRSTEILTYDSSVDGINFSPSTTFAFSPQNLEGGSGNTTTSSATVAATNAGGTAQASIPTTDVGS